jgi:hypothetical protein
MFHLASVMISMHQCQLCGSCGADKMFLHLITKMSDQFFEKKVKGKAVPVIFN